MTTWVPSTPPNEGLFPLLTEAGLELQTEAGVTILAFPDNHLWGPDLPSGGTWTRVFPP